MRVWAVLRFRVMLVKRKGFEEDCLEVNMHRSIIFVPFAFLFSQAAVVQRIASSRFLRRLRRVQRQRRRLPALHL